MWSAANIFSGVVKKRKEFFMTMQKMMWRNYKYNEKRKKEEVVHCWITDSFWIQDEKSGINMKVLVSACIMGSNCKYNGKNNVNIRAINFLKDKEVISICPEVLAGMKIPRPCAEIVNGRVVDETGNDVSLEYDKAVSIALSKIKNENIDLVILQSRSPTCGVNQIYDGSFTGKLIGGMGLFAKELKQRGYKVIDVEEI